MREAKLIFQIPGNQSGWKTCENRIADLVKAAVSCGGCIRVFAGVKWRTDEPLMPEGFYLKSLWSASTFFDPAGKYSLDRYCAAANVAQKEPISISLFLDYGRWFQQQAVPEIDTTYVQSLARDGKGFHLDLADGRGLKAASVVIATGIAPFYYVPDFAENLPETLASHTQLHSDFSEYRGRNVVVVGTGQSGLESAALLHEAGAQVELK